MKHDTNNLPQSGFLRLPAVLEMIPISKSSWWDGIKLGIYPKPIRIGKRTTAWRIEDIQALIRDLSNNNQI